MSHLSPPAARDPTTGATGHGRASGWNVVALVAGLSLAGCAGLDQDDPLRNPSWMRALDAPLANLPVPEPKPEAPPRRRRTVVAEAPAATELPGQEPEVELVPELPALPDPPNLVGSDQSSVVTTLGVPIGVSETPPGVEWYYASPHCRLRVSFFMEVSSRTFRVLSYELSGYDNISDSERQCFAELVAQAKQQSG